MKPIGNYDPSYEIGSGADENFLILSKGVAYFMRVIFIHEQNYKQYGLASPIDYDLHFLEFFARKVRSPSHWKGRLQHLFGPNLPEYPAWPDPRFKAALQDLYKREKAGIEASVDSYQKWWDKNEGEFLRAKKLLTGSDFRHDIFFCYVSPIHSGISDWGGNTICTGATTVFNGNTIEAKWTPLHEMLLSDMHSKFKEMPEINAATLGITGDKFIEVKWGATEIATALLLSTEEMMDIYLGKEDTAAEKTNIFKRNIIRQFLDEPKPNIFLQNYGNLQEPLMRSVPVFRELYQRSVESEGNDPPDPLGALIQAIIPHVQEGFAPKTETVLQIQLDGAEPQPTPPGAKVNEAGKPHLSG